MCVPLEGQNTSVLNSRQCFRIGAQVGFISSLMANMAVVYWPWSGVSEDNVSKWILRAKVSQVIAVTVTFPFPHLRRWIFLLNWNLGCFLVKVGQYQHRIFVIVIENLYSWDFLKPPRKQFFFGKRIWSYHLAFSKGLANPCKKIKLLQPVHSWVVFPFKQFRCIKQSPFKQQRSSDLIRHLVQWHNDR